MFATLPACLRGEPVFMSETLYKTIKGFIPGPPLSHALQIGNILIYDDACRRDLSTPLMIPLCSLPLVLRN